MSITDGIKKHAVAISQEAMGRFLADESRATKLAQAIGAFQRGRKAFNRGQDEMMRVFNIAAKGDFKSIGKQLSAIKRRLRDLEEKLDKLPK